MRRALKPPKKITKETDDDARLMQQTGRAPRPSRRSSVMSSSSTSLSRTAVLGRSFDKTQSRRLIAASVVVLVAGSAMWVSYDALRVPGAVAPQINEATPPVVADVKESPKESPREAPKPTPEVRQDALAKIAGADGPRPARGAARNLIGGSGRTHPRRNPSERAHARNSRATDASCRAAEQTVPAEPVGRDQFAGTQQNGFKDVREAPVSTFSIDVDTASYSFMRASLNRNVLPQPDIRAHRELINYFPMITQRRRRRPSLSARQYRCFRRRGRRAARSFRSASRATRCLRHAAARQSRVPDRHLRLHERTKPAAAGQAVVVVVARAA